MKLVLYLTYGAAAFAAGAVISTLVYVAVVGHLIWEGDLD